MQDVPGPDEEEVQQTDREQYRKSPLVQRFEINAAPFQPLQLQANPRPNKKANSVLALSKNSQCSTSNKARSNAAVGSDSSCCSVDMMGAEANTVKLTRKTPNSATPRSTSMTSTRSAIPTGAGSLV